MSAHAVGAMLKERAAEAPERRALAFPAGVDAAGQPTWSWLTYGELDALADRYAAGFAATGLQRGERTLLLLKPSHDFYGVIFGLLRLGAIPVLLDPRMGLKPLLACIAHTQPTAIVAIPPVHVVRLLARGTFATVTKVYTAGRRLFWGGHTLEAVKAAGAGSFQGPDLAADDEAAIVFTSGSTGTPKGVSYRHGGFTSAARYIQEMYGLQPPTTIVECFAPFAVFDLCMGSSVVIPQMDLSRPASAEPARIVEAIQRTEASVAFASPIVWLNTVRWCQDKGVKLPSLRAVLSAGAPIPVDLHRRFREILPEGAQVHTPYGCTEGMPVASVATDAILSETAALTEQGAGTCVGALAPGIDVRIVRITDEPMPTWSEDLREEPGQIGEIVIGGAVVSPEYKELPEANRLSKIDDGGRTLHRMGDLGYLDATGRLWFCGRKAHRIRAASGMIPADPVEGVFNAHPKVWRSALVGVGEPGAEVPVLCVELEKGQTWTNEDEAALLALADDTRYARLVRAVLVHPGFPVDARHNSKIRREDLKVWATGKLPRKALEAT